MGKHVQKTLKKEERYHFRHNLKIKEDLCARTQMKPFMEVVYQKTISRRHQNDKDTGLSMRRSRRPIGGKHLLELLQYRRD